MSFRTSHQPPPAPGNNGPYSVEQIAQVCHEANRAIQLIQADPGVPVAATWDKFEGQAAVVDGVIWAQQGATPEHLHKTWCDFKQIEGYVYGPVKDAEQKTHPCLVPYEELPAKQRTKDRLFKAIVTVLSQGE